MTEHVVAAADEVSEGDRVVVQIQGREIGVFKKDGEYHAFLNWCPHQGGPVCEGPVSGTQETTFDTESLELTSEWTREGEILNCPWHGWEFELESGECLSRSDVQLPTYPVSVEDGDIVVEL